MIDVVFLLLVFFIVTLDPADLLASLPVSRPRLATSEKVKEPPAFRLTVSADRYEVNGQIVDLKYIDWYLREKHRKLGADDALIICEGESQHSRLLQALDVFEKNKVTNLSLISM
jgi:biopolymer transport protein ExbD